MRDKAVVQPTFQKNNSSSPAICLWKQERAFCGLCSRNAHPEANPHIPVFCLEAPLQAPTSSADAVTGCDPTDRAEAQG